MITLHRLSVRVSSNRFLIFINPSNYNGAAALQLLTKLRPLADNRLCVNSHDIRFLSTGSQSVTVIFRSCTLCPRVAICRGVTFDLTLRNLNGNRVRRQIRQTTRRVKLSGLLRHGPERLSKKRQRQITIYQTVIHGPTIFLVSRPLSGLSTRLQIRTQSRVDHLRQRLNDAFICIARSRIRTVAVNAHVTILRRNILRRISAPRALCDQPGGGFITKFVNDPTVGFIRNILIRQTNRI